MTEIGKAMLEILDKHQGDLERVYYDGDQPFLIVSGGWDVVNAIVDEARALYPDDITDIEDVVIEACEIKSYSPVVWGFDDQWKTCVSCGNAIDIIPSGAHWMPDYWLVDGEGYYCGDDIRIDPD